MVLCSKTTPSCGHPSLKKGGELCAVGFVLRGKVTLFFLFGNINGGVFFVFCWVGVWFGDKKNAPKQGHRSARRSRIGRVRLAILCRCSGMLFIKRLLRIWGSRFFKPILAQNEITIYLSICKVTFKFFPIIVNYNAACSFLHGFYNLSFSRFLYLFF